MRRHFTVLVALVAFALVALIPSSARAIPPKGDAFGGLMMFADPYTGEMVMLHACVRFVNRKKLCASDEECGTWQFTEKNRKRNRWEGEIVLDFDGIPLQFQFHGMTENTGKVNARAMSAIGYAPEMGMNAAFAGIRMPLEQCVAFATVEDD